ncbi:MAG TPA: hypothetical protein VGO11_22080, partial [Chthoniobacteraceae bacterium]|jgi:hypothetical protein|nr:hypothetical protein [Chthoniobacteraceae bacterium]
LIAFQSFKGDRVTAATVRAFVMQFPEKLQDAVLCLLENTEMIEPRTVASLVVKHFKELRAQGVKRVAIVPIGNMTDSASHLLYELKHHPDPEIQAIGPTIAPLQAATLKTSDHVIFFDDNVNSGHQVLNVFADWLGVELPEGVNLGEKHVDPLPAAAQDKLRTIPISLVFGVGPEGVEEIVSKLFKEYLTIDPSKVFMEVGKTLHANQRLLSGDEAPVDIPRRRELREFLDEVGRALMLDERKSPEAAERRALGDSRAEGLVVFPYNTPTMTITALWCRGVFKNREWTPLIERRRNRRPDGELCGEDS